MVGTITWVASKLEDVKPGRNELAVKSMQFGLQKMIMEKDVPIKVRDGDGVQSLLVQIAMRSMGLAELFYRGPARGDEKAPPHR